MAKHPTIRSGSIDPGFLLKTGPFFTGPRLLQVLVIAAAVAWIYTPVLHGEWLWDDNVDITDNTITQSPAGLWSIWFKPGTQLDYYPLKASVQWLQWHLWSDNTLGYHLTNVVLHFASALLVWRLLAKLGLRLAWLGGLLFAVHPVQVESVAWIAELKNTLSMPLFLLAMIFYVDYDTTGSRRDYFLALGCFLLAMLAKTTVVMFPVAILLYAWWKRGRLDPRDVKAAAPFFVVSLVLGWITLWCGVWYNDLHHLVYQVPDLGGPLARLAFTGTSLAFYFRNVVWPVELIPIYAQWTVNPPSLSELLPLPVLAFLFLGSWKYRAGWGRHTLLGLGFFVLMLAPFVTIRIAGYMDFAWVMDHFLYVPILGPIGLAVAGLEALDRCTAPGFRISLWMVVVVIVALLTGKSRGYAKRFADERGFNAYTVRHNPTAWPALNNLANSYYLAGEFDQAQVDYEAVLKFNPTYAPSLCNIGHIRQIAGDLDGALRDLDHAIEADPNSAEPYYSRALVRLARGNLDGARDDLLMTVKIAPAGMYADYTHLLLWRIRLAQQQPTLGDQELAAALAKGWNAPPDQWVSQVARFLLGRMDERAFFAATAAPLKTKEQEQLCEAWYFAGLKRLASGDHAGAIVDFQKCLDTHERPSAEYMLALAELKALGAPAP